MTGTKNKIEDLRNHLFQTLEDLRDPEKPMDVERARVIAGVAQEIIQSAKVEVEFLRVTGQRSSTGFIPAELPVAPTGPSAVPRRRLSS